VDSVCIVERALAIHLLSILWVLLNAVLDVPHCVYRTQDRHMSFSASALCIPFVTASRKSRHVTIFLQPFCGVLAVVLAQVTAEPQCQDLCSRSLERDGKSQEVELKGLLVNTNAKAKRR